MTSIESQEQEIIAEFNQLETVDAKYAHLFKLAEALPHMPAALKTDANLVKGCQSTLWFNIHVEQGRLYLSADSDSLVIKGIAALLVKLVEGRHPAEVLTVDFDFLDQIGLWKLESRQNPGLVAMLAHLKRQAQSIIDLEG